MPRATRKRVVPGSIQIKTVVASPTGGQVRISMARECSVCGKGPQMGNSVETRGKAKYLGGVGTKITGITRRQFKPNLQRVRITTENGSTKTVRVCTSCLRSGAVTRLVRRRPFNLPLDKSSDKSKSGDKSKAGS